MSTAKNRFRSGWEETVARQLKELGVKFQYEQYSYQYEEPLRKNKAKCGDCGSTNLTRLGWYTPDFFLPNGTIIEAKGKFSAADRRKMLAVIAQHPKERFVMCFMRDNKIDRRSSTKYSDWCQANGIDYSVGAIKGDWL